MTSTLITHITTKAAWAEAIHAGRYRHPSLERQGFIHFSEPTEGQLVAVANALYAGESDLVVLVVDRGQLSAPLRYEEFAPGSQKFPHLYGVLNLDAVVHILDFNPGSDGKFSLPDELR